MGMQIIPHVTHIIKFGNTFLKNDTQAFFDDLSDEHIHFWLAEWEGGGVFEIYREQLEEYLNLKKEKKQRFIGGEEGSARVAVKDIIAMCEYMLDRAVTEDGWVHATLEGY